MTAPGSTIRKLAAPRHWRSACCALAGALIMSSLSPAAVAGLRIDGTDPVEMQEEGRVEATAVGGMRRCGVRSDPRFAQPAQPVACCAKVRPCCDAPFHSGHRFVNGLLAPLTC